ncbi:fha domain [Stylonychia lemnae]|uniref:Fha domain n=1 Tax=Stylonychia lemnae TaxID=5949 RepID=A0A078A3C5_STYLE|nr:fha domain [Stylonychia lemnae]|eukprot:CDW75264.1 fha domain [Stylonychia lemnae]
MNLIHLEQRSFDRNNNSTIGDNISRHNIFSGLSPVYPARQVKIMSKTWHRDSHGLFDFEASIYIQRSQTDEMNILPPKATSIKQREDSLATVIYSQGKYFVYHANDIDVNSNNLNQTIKQTEEMTQVIMDLTKKVYLVVKNLTLKGKKSSLRESQRFDDFDENKGIILRVGDIVKFGRVPFRIKESSVQKSLNRIESQQNQDNSLEKNITDVESEGDQDINQVINDMIMTQAKQDSPRRRIILNNMHDGGILDHQESDIMYAASPRQADILQDSIDDPYRLASFNNRESNFHDIQNSLFSNNEFLVPQLFMTKNHSLNDQKQKLQDETEKLLMLNKNSKSAKVANVKSCRICLGEENDIDNELINPCKCAGTMKYIHLQCLQEWLNDYVKDSKKKIEIYKINRPTDGQYLIMEVLGMPNGRTFQIIRLSERHTLKVVSCLTPNKYIQGRGHDSDVRVADISVSRCHSLLRYDQDRNLIILTDYHSKFGTLLLLRKPAQLSTKLNKEFMIQTGRTMLTLTLQDVPTPFINKICSCVVSKKQKEQHLKKQLALDFEYFQCTDYLPKDLLKRKRELFGDLLSKIISPQTSKHETKRDELGPNDEEMHQYFSELTQHNQGISRSNLSNQKHTGKLNQVAPLIAFNQFANGNITQTENLTIGLNTARQNNKERSISVRLVQSSENNQINTQTRFANPNSRPQSNAMTQHQLTVNNSPSPRALNIQPTVDFRIRVNETHQQLATPSNPQNIREEIKEEEEEKLMDEICKEQEEKDSLQKPVNSNANINLQFDPQRDNPSQFEITSNMNRTQQLLNRQQMGTVNAQEEQEQIGFQ